MKHQTVEINGTVYDKVTGMPIRHAESATKQSPSYAQSIHQTTQKSTTLQRKYVASPVAKPVAVAAPAPATATASPAIARPARSPMIQKYAKTPSVPQRPAQPIRRTSIINDFGPVAH